MRSAIVFHDIVVNEKGSGSNQKDKAMISSGQLVSNQGDTIQTATTPLLETDNPFALVIIAAQQEAIYDDKFQDGLLKTRMKIGSFLYFMDQLIPLTDKKLKCIFDQELTTLFGGNITTGIHTK